MTKKSSNFLASLLVAFLSYLMTSFFVMWLCSVAHQYATPVIPAIGYLDASRLVAVIFIWRICNYFLIAFGGALKE